MSKLIFLFVKNLKNIKMPLFKRKFHIECFSTEHEAQLSLNASSSPVIEFSEAVNRLQQEIYVKLQLNDNNAIITKLNTMLTWARRKRFEIISNYEWSGINYYTIPKKALKELKSAIVYDLYTTLYYYNDDFDTFLYTKKTNIEDYSCYFVDDQYYHLTEKIKKKLPEGIYFYKDYKNMLKALVIYQKGIEEAQEEIEISDYNNFPIKKPSNENSITHLQGITKIPNTHQIQKVKKIVETKREKTTYPEADDDDLFALHNWLNTSKYTKEIIKGHKNNTHSISSKNEFHRTTATKKKKKITYIKKNVHKNNAYSNQKSQQIMKKPLSKNQQSIIFILTDGNKIIFTVPENQMLGDKACIVKLFEKIGYSTESEMAFISQGKKIESFDQLSPIKNFNPHKKDIIKSENRVIVFNHGTRNTSYPIEYSSNNRNLKLIESKNIALKQIKYENNRRNLESNCHELIKDERESQTCCNINWWKLFAILNTVAFFGSLGVSIDGYVQSKGVNYTLTSKESMYQAFGTAGVFVTLLLGLIAYKIHKCKNKQVDNIGNENNLQIFIAKR